MLIDWFTVVAQLINFVILLVALKYLLYDRVLEAMDRRRKRIDQRAEEAEAKKEEAESRAEQLQEERAELEHQRDRLMEEARERAREREEELLEDARGRIEEQERRWRESLGEEQSQLLDDLERGTLDAAIALSRRALKDLANKDLEVAIVDRFLVLLQELSDETRQRLEEAVDEEAHVRVTSGFDLSGSDRDEIRQIIKGLTETAVDIDWRTDDEIGAGLSMVIGDHEISWDFSDYVDEVAERLEQRLREEARSNEEASEVEDEEAESGASAEQQERESEVDEGAKAS